MLSQSSVSLRRFVAKTCFLKLHQLKSANYCQTPQPAGCLEPSGHFDAGYPTVIGSATVDFGHHACAGLGWNLQAEAGVGVGDVCELDSMKAIPLLQVRVSRTQSGLSPTENI